MDPITIALTVLALPLIAFVLQVFVGRFLPRQGDWLPTLAMAVALALSVYLFATQVLGSPEGMTPITKEWDWIKIGIGGADLEIKFGVLVDNLTAAMLIVVTLVSFLVHLYSIGYMHGEVRYNRFFAFLALFTFSMLGLVITNNLLVLFIFWELVGVCSYFLIGFYIEKKSAGNASMKAFLTTRVGDLGFMIGIMMILPIAKSLGFKEIFESVHRGFGDAPGMWTSASLTMAAIFLFLGPVGKSGQFPLHIWLPDAMEGPTPVSALIHAATMVAAGVYLVARMFPFFAGPAYFNGGDWLRESTPLHVVAFVGGFTSIFAATIAIVQTDIKKVLAYSTVSQLGYMMLGIGTGSFMAGTFHLFTHAFFKALLFLGAGSVIHAVHSNEMTAMGGLRKKMPITFATFVIATCAISGVPFLFSGFYSKEAVLTQAAAFGSFMGGGVWNLPFIFAIITAALTAFYMFRIVFLTFTGEPRDHHRYDHAHESPMTMAVPLIVLGVLSVVSAGFIGFGDGWFDSRVSPIFGSFLGMAHLGGGEAAEAFEHAHEAAHGTVMAMSIGAAALGIFASWLVFSGPLKKVNFNVGPLKAYGALLRNLYFVDWFFTRVVVGIVLFVRLVAGFFDKYVVDGIVNLCGWITRGIAILSGFIDYRGVDGSVRGVGWLTLAFGQAMRRLQSGRLQEYVVLSVFAFALIFIVVILGARFFAL
ncbi:MAG: NADH-quinone oxidoreductase subunit L [Planctomycetes bacterium]|nr:NADH-quinone oxidoreductase subunit L [Planctomycetota bacterium]